MNATTLITVLKVCVCVCSGWTLSTWITFLFSFWMSTTTSRMIGSNRKPSLTRFYLTSLVLTLCYFFFTSEDLYSAILSDLESVFSCRSESFSPRCRDVCDVSSVICWLDDPVTHCKCCCVKLSKFPVFFKLSPTPSGSVGVVLTVQNFTDFYFLLQSFSLLFHFMCIYIVFIPIFVYIYWNVACSVSVCVCVCVCVSVWEHYVV